MYSLLGIIYLITSFCALSLIIVGIILYVNKDKKAKYFNIVGGLLLINPLIYLIWL